jgi:hypothetical protein
MPGKPKCKAQNPNEALNFEHWRARSFAQKTQRSLEVD